MLAEMIQILLLYVLLIFCCESSIINYSLTKMLSVNNTESYFGYSILLQKGNPPIAIIGASNKNGRNLNRGTVYQCNLNTLSCSEYSKILKESSEVYIPDKNGNFLGSVLDGDDITGSSFFTCAPHVVRRFDTENYFTNGRCFHIKNSYRINEVAQELFPLNNARDVNVYQSQAFYDAAFGESGFDMVYLKDQNELITGAPGKAHWTGGLIQTKLNSGYTNTIFAKLENWINNRDHYYGYAVSWGKFIRGSNEIWYVSGAPRGGGFNGSVAFFDKSTGRLKAELFGEEYGSYFGASILVIRNKNGGDDILIGAPMSAGKSWDEGCVYYYRNKDKGGFHAPKKLLGKGPKSRFGTVIADPGDINLDSFRDCAISAPYENDGIGAVYLYYGTPEGFLDDNYHKIAPSNFVTLFPRTTIKGFGLGISRGNDIDNNGHTDIAIGAFQSGQVFHFTTYDVINVKLNLTSSVHTVYSTTRTFSVEYCLLYTQRNKKSSYKNFMTQVLLLDDRIENEQKIVENPNIPSDKWYCKEHVVKLKDDYLEMEPLTVTYKCRYLNDNFKEKILKVPFLYGCGENKICHTNISLKISYRDIPRLVIGLTNEVQLNVTVENSGEPAFHTKLYLTVPPEIGLINLRECYFEHGNYICSIPGLFKGKTVKPFLFDLTNVAPNCTNLPIKLRIENDGKEVNPDDDELNIDIPVLLQNSPYIESKYQSSSILLTEKKGNLEMDHSFKVGNQGPSPLKLTLVILVPKLEVNGTKFLEITTIESVSSGMINKCTYLNESNIDIENIEITPIRNNNSITLSCFESQLSCMQILCEGGYFPKSSENAEISLKLNVSAKYLTIFSGDKDAVTIVSAIYLNGTKNVTATSSTTIYGLSSISSKIPLWIYICSIIAGITLLLLMTLLLYKCNFFKRTYREKLENEEDKDDQEEKQEKEEIEEKK